ncbi:hypothetical protein [Brevibacillus laterosporus]|uniref:hypothetical protein n=1 Tax=Brevibacillus laterosporus TaxID=1465 RepID=UPI000CE45708|nr:hypothetical protein [Brevibacillus laterosporus]PPA84121.1 hypothetical protein C4A75_13655 [Brevibacillus laterosporus]
MGAKLRKKGKSMGSAITSSKYCRILASFEAFKLIVRRSSLLPILSSQLIRIDLAHNEMVTVMNPQNGSWNYSEL